MAEARKKTTTKAKTKPAAKPAKKSTNKVTAKSTVTKTNKSTPARTTSKTSSNKTTTPTSHDNKAGKVILTILISVTIIAVVAGIVTAIICHNRKNSDTVMIENGKGETIEAKYINLEDYKYSIAVPTSFKELSADEIKEKYSTNATPIAAYENDGSTINIIVQKPDNKLSNEQIKEYLDAMKTIFATSADVIDSDYYTVGDHNVGTIRISSEESGKKFYSQVAIFSYDDKLALITFSCEDSERTEWEKVGQDIIKSLKFIK